jgi:hypothetical protein
MPKDFTKYNVEGLGENLNKRKLIFTVVKDWIEKNNPSFEELQKTFPDEVQGNKGFIRIEADVKTVKHFNMREPLKIMNDIHVVVSNQWGENCKDFIELALSLGYKIKPENNANAVTDKDITTDVNLFDVDCLKEAFPESKEFCVYFNTDHWILAEEDFQPEAAFLKFTVNEKGELLEWNVYHDEVIPYLELPESWHEMKRVLSGYIEVDNIENSIENISFNNDSDFYELCCDVLEYVKEQNSNIETDNVISTEENSNAISVVNDDVELNIEFDNNFPGSFINLLKANRKNEGNLDAIDTFIERGLAVSHLNYGAGKIFEALSSRGHADRNEDFVSPYTYSKEDYDVAFSLSEDVSELKEKLQEQNLIDIILEYEAIENIESLEFKLFYPAYLISVVNKLAELEDGEMLAEFIASQSLGFSRFVDDSGYEYGSDWVLELCDELIGVLYGIDSSSDDYNNEITLSGNYFGVSMDAGVDYIKISEEIIAQVI